VLRGERGTSVVEMALVLPVLLILLLGALDFGSTVVLSNMTAEAARDGARAAQVLITQGDVSLDATELDQIQTAARLVTGPLAGLGAGLSVAIYTEQDADGYYYVKARATTSYTPIARQFLGRIGTASVSASSKLAVACGKC
jgi:Flp pilus assembly protein TadG